MIFGKDFNKTKYLFPNFLVAFNRLFVKTSDHSKNAMGKFGEGIITVVLTDSKVDIATIDHVDIDLTQYSDVFENLSVDVGRFQYLVFQTVCVI